MITKRQSQLLTTIIREYIKRAQPIGSQVITQHCKLSVSSATVRNDMAALEQEGFLTQPHTSAGRLPTERAWKFYLDQVVTSASAPDALRKRFKEFLDNHKGDDLNTVLKLMAQQLAEWARETVVVAFTPHDLYYTGLSQLFQQPEFEEHDLVTSFSDIMDHLDGVMSALYPSVTDDVQVLIGRDNPFSSDCGAVLVRTSARGRNAVIALLGPTRQPYHDIIPMVKYTQEALRTW